MPVGATNDDPSATQQRARKVFPRRSTDICQNPRDHPEDDPYQPARHAWSSGRRRRRAAAFARSLIFCRVALFQEIPQSSDHVRIGRWEGDLLVRDKRSCLDRVLEYLL